MAELARNISNNVCEIYVSLEKLFFYTRLLTFANYDTSLH